MSAAAGAQSAVGVPELKRSATRVLPQAPQAAASLAASEAKDADTRLEDPEVLLALIEEVTEATSYQGFDAAHFRSQVRDKGMGKNVVVQFLSASAQIGNNPAKLLNAQKVTNTQVSAGLHAMMSRYGFADPAGTGRRREFTLARLEISYLVPYYLIRLLMSGKGKIQNQFRNTVPPELQSPSMAAVAAQVNRIEDFRRYSDMFRAALKVEDKGADWVQIAIDGANADPGFIATREFIREYPNNEAIAEAIMASLTALAAA